LSGKLGNVGEFDSCQGMSEKISSGRSGKNILIVSYIFASILEFAELLHLIVVSDHALLRSCLHH